MEQNIKQCCIVLEPISSELSTKLSTPKCDRNRKQNFLTPQRTKMDKTSKFSSTENGSITPCVVRLENIAMHNDKFEKSTTATELPSRSGVLFEPITPKAHIEFSLELKKAINERNILTSKTKRHVFDALDEIKSKTDEERRSFKREQALLEIVNSEIKYVHQLETIINFFMKPSKERNLLKLNDYNIVFRNIYSIYNVNKELLDGLDKGVENIAKAFSKIAPFLKLYSVYAYEFKSILNILQNARSLNPRFANFIENQETRPEVQNKLSALLITPIQRIPRYKLLLTNLYNLTKPSEEGFDMLSDCLGKIEEVAEHINKVVEDQENMQRLLEFQRCLRGEPNVITPGRKLIKEGILTKMSTKHSHSEKLYIVLMNDIILFSKMKKDEPKVNSLKCLSIFPLNKCKVIEILDKGCLKVVCQDEELILYHDQFSETKNWIKTIKETIDEHLKDRKTLRKESSARRPVKRKDLHEYHEIGLSPGRPLKRKRFDVDIKDENSVPNRKILKRKPIHDMSGETSENKNLHSLIASEPTSSTITKNDTKNDHEVPEVAKNICFENPHNNGVNRLGRLIGDIGVSIRRFLGFRN